METLEPNNLWYLFTGQCSHGVMLQGFDELNALEIKYTLTSREHFLLLLLFFLTGDIYGSEQE